MGLREKLAAGEFVVTVEVDPPRGTDVSPILEGLGPLVERIDAINLTDAPTAQVRMSPVALGALLQQKLETETIFHLTCRDRNRIALESELLGAHALGLRSFLALGGDPTLKEAKPVFDLDTLGLIRTGRSLNQGFLPDGRRLAGATDFLIGAAANPGTSDLPREIGRLLEKMEAGAGFIQTQPVFDLDRARSFAAAALPLGLPILYGVMPLPSLKVARFLHEEVPGITIPPAVMSRMEAADQPETGLAIALELAAQLRGLGAGLHIFPNRRFHLVGDLLAA